MLVISPGNAGFTLQPGAPHTAANAVVVGGRFWIGAHFAGSTGTASPVTWQTGVVCDGKDDDAAILRTIDEREWKVFDKDAPRAGRRWRPSEWKRESADSGLFHPPLSD